MKLSKLVSMYRMANDAFWALPEEQKKQVEAGVRNLAAKMPNPPKDWRTPAAIALVAGTEALRRKLMSDENG